MVGWEEFTELEPMELLAAERGMAVGVEDVGEAIEVEGEREVVGPIIFCYHHWVLSTTQMLKMMTRTRKHNNLLHNKISPHNQSRPTFPNSSIHPTSSNNRIYLNQDLYQFLMKLPSWMMSEPLCKLALPLTRGTTMRAISLD